MDKKFKAGDRVRLKKSGTIASVVIAKDGWIAYDENRRIGGACPMEDVEPIDPKTAFLSELKELMSKYHAHFEVDFATQATYLIIGKERYPYLVPKYIEKE